MPIRLPRLTVRRLMILVGLVALAIAGSLQAIRLRRLSRDYSALANYHAGREQFARSGVQRSHEDWLVNYRRTRQAVEAGTIRFDADRPSQYFSPPPDVQWKLFEYHCRMREKYERSAHYPWITPAPNPPEPGWKWDSEP